MNTPDTEIVLTHGATRLHVSPYGASLRGLTHNGQPVVTAYTGAQGKVGGQGDVLVPFPGRIREGRYSFGGHPYQLARNDKEGPNAIHGFLRTVLWETENQSDTETTFSATIQPQDHPGYPFSCTPRSPGKSSTAASAAPSASKIPATCPLRSQQASTPTSP